MTVSQNSTRRNYKDSVFVDLFAHNISAKENFISLYNALHGTNLDVSINYVLKSLPYSTVFFALS